MNMYFILKVAFTHLYQAKPKPEYPSVSTNGSLIPAGFAPSDPGDNNSFPMASASNSNTSLWACNIFRVSRLAPLLLVSINELIFDN